MKDFTYYAPTRMVFGKDSHKQVGALIREYGYGSRAGHLGLAGLCFMVFHRA